jgi:hypothetical protein
MAIRTPRELATHLRANAVNCEEAAGRQVLADGRARLLILAEQYWRLADKIDAPRARRRVPSNPSVSAAPREVRSAEL